MKIEISCDDQYVGTLGPEEGVFHIARANAKVSWSGDDITQRQVNVTCLETGSTEGIGINPGESYVFPIDQKYSGPFGKNEITLRNEIKITGIQSI